MSLSFRSWHRRWGHVSITTQDIVVFCVRYAAFWTSSGSSNSKRWRRSSSKPRPSHSPSLGAAIPFPLWLCSHLRSLLRRITKAFGNTFGCHGQVLSRCTLTFSHFLQVGEVRVKFKNKSPLRLWFSAWNRLSVFTPHPTSPNIISFVPNAYSLSFFHFEVFPF